MAAKITMASGVALLSLLMLLGGLAKPAKHDTSDRFIRKHIPIAWYQEVGLGGLMLICSLGYIYQTLKKR
jgi:hypothetical protein